MDNQFPEGYWLSTYPHVEHEHVLEINAEFVVHTDTNATADEQIPSPIPGSFPSVCRFPVELPYLLLDL